MKGEQIVIKPETKRILAKKKLCDTETFDSVIQRLLHLKCDGAVLRKRT